MALAPGDPEALPSLRRRGFAALRLSPLQREALCAARQAAAEFLASEGRREAAYHGPKRHPLHSALVLNGLGYVSTPGYAGREQFHSIIGASDVCPWPKDGALDFREVFEAGAAVLESLCLDLLQRVDPSAVAEWRREVGARGDPSVCDAFRYPAAAASAQRTEDRVAMGGHLDPGWFTVKQGSLDGGLELFDAGEQAWVNVEEEAFYAGSCESDAARPEDSAVIFAGERLEAWTEGAIPAVLHRALSCPADRISFIYELRDADTKVRVRIIRAEGLKNMDGFGKRQDPYCRLSLGSMEGQTAVVPGGGTEPVWAGDSGLVLLPWRPGEDGGDKLRIAIMDRDAISPDEFIGEAWLNMPALFRLGSFSGAVRVYRRGTKVRGALTLEVSFDGGAPPPPPTATVPLEAATSGHGLLVEAVPAKAHSNHVAGLLHCLQEGDTYQGFLTYEVALRGVAETFGEAWSAGRNGQHPETFAEDARGMLTRKALSALHAQLYFDEVVGGPRGLRTTVHFLGSGRDFLAMIGEGVRDKRRRVFTYSLTDNGLFFSESGAALSKDSLSKHAIHANAAMSVRYAGTFRICQDGTGGCLLVADNDSGTYRPKGEHQPLLAALLEANLPGLRVLTLDVLEPQPEWTKDLRGPNERRGDDAAVYAGSWIWQL